MELYIIRHTPINIETGTCYGQSNVEVDEQLNDYVQLYANKLPNDFDAIFSSPLNRCKSLADRLTNQEIELDDRLMEMHFGDWEMKKWSVIPYEESDNWMNHFDIVPTPNGESMLDLFNRILSFYTDLKNKNFNKVLIVTHAGPIRCFWSIILEISLKNSFKIPVGFGEVFVIDTKFETIKQKA